jgi:RHS repeat-associated protein
MKIKPFLRGCWIRQSLLVWSAMATVLFLGVSSSSGACQVPVYIEYKATSAELSKCGFFEYTNVNLPRVSVFHQQVVQYSHHLTFEQGGTNGYYSMGTGCWDVSAGDGPYHSNAVDDTTFTIQGYCPVSTCIITNSYSGAVTHFDEGSDGRNTIHLPDGGGCDSCSFGTTYTYGKDTNSQIPQYSSGTWYMIYEDDNTNYAMGQTSCQGPLNPTGGSHYFGTNTPPGVVDYGDLLISLAQTHEGYTMSSPNNNIGPDYYYTETGHTTWDLSYEYTDGELWSNIVAQMPAYSTNWTFPWDYLPPAESLIEGSHVNGNYWYPYFTLSGNAMLQKVKYRFCIPNSEAGKKYTVTYDLFTWDYPNAAPTHVTKSITVVGTGDQVNPATAELPDFLPYWDNSPTYWGGIIWQWVENPVATVQNGPTGPAGSAVTLTAGSGCNSCGSGSSQNHGASLFAEFSLGNATNGFAVDSLTLSAAVPAPKLATPSSLSVSEDSETEVISTNDAIRQITAPETFVDIVTDSDFSYEIRYYYRSQRGSFNGSVYSVSGSPFVVWKVENPDASTNSFNRIRITETRGTDSKIYDYSFTTTANENILRLDYPGGLREDEWDEATILAADIYGQTNYTRYETNIVRVPAGPDQFKSVKVYQHFGGLYGGYEALVREIIDPDNQPRITAYSYYNYMYQNGSAKPLKLVVHPDGSWEYYIYTLNGVLLVPSDVYYGYGDTPAPSDVPDDSTCRHVQYSYYPISGDDDGSMFPDEARQTVTYVKGNVVSKNFLIAFPGVRQDLRCVDLDYNWDYAHNLVTITKYYTNGANINKVMSIMNPDGTMSLYDYDTAADGSVTNIVYTGQPNTDGTAIIDGTKTVTILGPLGQMLSSSEIDITSGIITSQDVYGNYDGLNRPQQVTHLDGTMEQTQYSCCGVDNTTDRDGVVTQYLYDAMKRQVGSTRSNITKTNVLDAAGRTLRTTRIGSDNSQIVMSQSAYDVGGQLISQTNALGGVTSYIHTTNSSTGARVDITINPDGGTETNLYFVDGSLKQTSGTSVHGVRYEHDSGYGYETISEIKLNGNYSDTAEAVTNFTDAVGRSYQTIYSDGATNLSFYNALGQLWKSIDPDGVTTIYQYNAKGEQEYTAIDMDHSDAIELGGTDRVTRTVNDVTTYGGVNVRRSRLYSWMGNGSSTSTLLSVMERSVDGLRSWETEYRDAATGITGQSVTVYSTGGNRYSTNVAPDGSYSVTTYLNGRVTSLKRSDSTGSQLFSESYSYDAHGRRYSSTDARNGTTTYAYNNADLVSSVTTPGAGNGVSPQTTITYYNASLEATNVLNPDGTSVITEYLPTGELLETHGSRTFPVAYTYDYAGRMKTMKTWQNFAGNSGTATTTWAYDGYRGFLTNKTFEGGINGPTFGYTPGGRIMSRVWARGITTTYSYDSAGQLAVVSYSDGATSSTTNTYDRMGRIIEVGSSNQICQYSYNLANEVLVETNTVGILAGLAVTNGYDSNIRRVDMAALGSGVLSHTTYGYDYASRLSMASDGTNIVTYSYIANSPLVSQITFKSNNVIRMTTTKQYDFLNRLTQISNAPTASAAVAFNPLYNSANQRTKITLVDGSYWLYQYDPLGQVTSGKKYWRDGTPVAGQQFEYTFDDIGNRTRITSGGDAAGVNLRPANYTNNRLNQVVGRDVSGYVDITGIALATNSVTVNGQTAYRKGEYFRNELSVNNSNVALWTNITVASPGQPTTLGSKYVLKTPEVFSYDADGNLTNDGRWLYRWDGENRLVQMMVNTNIGPQYQLTFLYDSRGRRIQKQVAAGGIAVSTNKFVYDGWNVVAELDGNNALIQRLMWGSDLSGSLQGVGGAGGLLLIGTPTNNFFIGYDGNANVTILVNTADGGNGANYEYGPFGETIRSTGAFTKGNQIRFASKWQDDESDFLCYGFRYYNPLDGKWLSRDPLGENGGANLYAYVQNNGVDKGDILGLQEYRVVGKSFINGFGPSGFLGLRIGGIDPFPPFASPFDFDPAYADIRLFMFHNIIRGLGLENPGAPFNQNPTDDSQDGLYRLYFRTTVHVNCNGGQFLSASMDPIEMEGGEEFPTVFGTINATATLSTTSGSAILKFRTWGHPNIKAEPGMQWVALRTSRNIWHEGMIQFNCCKAHVLDFSGSRYPSRKLWVNGSLQKYIVQGPISSLWNADPNDSSFVAP